MVIKVKLRQKVISGNRHSLYLDFYPAVLNFKTGKPTRREFLGIYLTDKLVSPSDKQNNKEKLQRAEQIRQIRENEVNKPEIYTGFEKEQLRLKNLGEKSFVEYFKSLVDKRKGSNYDNWVSSYKYFETFTKGSLKFSDLDQKFCNSFKEYLLTTKSIKNNKVGLSQNSALSYFNKFKATLKQAFKDGYLLSDLNSKVSPIKEAETHRNFLTLEEVNILVKTECKNPLMKTVAIFSALTGLRFSDINNLVWGDIEFIKDNGYYIKFIQQKTKGVEMMPISEQAHQLMGKSREPKNKIFESLKYSAYQNIHLANWIKSAGITKKITFHCFRHTFATLQLSEGTDLYTISKMLGHRELKTTQIYAKIMDSTKREASNKIKLDF
jgi:integrase